MGEGDGAKDVVDEAHDARSSRNAQDPTLESEALRATDGRLREPRREQAIRRRHERPGLIGVPHQAPLPRLQRQWPAHEVKARARFEPPLQKKRELAGPSDRPLVGGEGVVADGPKGVPRVMGPNREADFQHVQLPSDDPGDQHCRFATTSPDAPTHPVRNRRRPTRQSPRPEEQPPEHAEGVDYTEVVDTPARLPFVKRVRVTRASQNGDPLPGPAC
jgi:hypothetical protein